ncbi:hypothetical protein CIK05_04005 [Bdellovibrio sp. qaytius]|nr:hypothetical protein CIK05_04005 [Bdellovibrio sp. qaytius]
MIKLITFFLLLASITQAATKVEKSEKNTLEINLKGDAVTIKLPDVAQQVLTKWNPDFKPFDRKDYSKSIIELFKDIGVNQMPMAFIDDLDGNGKKDIVLLGNDKKNQFVVALLQLDKKWTLIKVDQMDIENIKDTEIPTEVSGTSVVKETGIPLYILQAQGEHATKLKEKKKVGIQVETYLGAGDVFEITDSTDGMKAVKFMLD